MGDAIETGFSLLPVVGATVGTDGDEHAHVVGRQEHGGRRQCREVEAGNSDDIGGKQAAHQDSSRRQKPKAGEEIESLAQQ